MSKAIVLFYSFEGNTRKIGEFLAEKLDLPFEEVKPVKEIRSRGFSKYFWGGSQVVMNKKPELVPLTTNLDEYDMVFLGSPVWAGSFTPPMKTFLEGGILKDKKIAFFYCHDGGPGRVEDKMKVSANINNHLISSYGLTKVSINFETIKDEVLEWAKEILGNVDE